jgi:hypothetical protein
MMQARARWNVSSQLSVCLTLSSDLLEVGLGFPPRWLVGKAGRYF